MKFHFVAADLGTSRFMAEVWERDDFFFLCKGLGAFIKVQ